ncbi:MAG: 4-vinyl reductase [Chloroflexi bacterium]|nr:4-vinyl reductase [Chloroflexota bacterium]
MDLERKYKFSWDLLGDIQLGRPNLGNNTRLEIYRLMQFAFRDVIEQQCGTHLADEIFFKAGKLAGEAFYNHMLYGVHDFDDFGEFVKCLQQVLKDMGVGIMRIEKADLEAGSFIITVSEDLDCSGLPELDYEVCKYDEGFITALMEKFTGKQFVVREVDCWCTGNRTCRFTADAVN